MDYKSLKAVLVDYQYSLIDISNASKFKSTTYSAYSNCLLL